MGFFQQVSKGDKVRFTAEFHNAVVRAVNAVLGGSGNGTGGLARTRTTIPIEASEAINEGTPVELVGQSDFSWGTRPYLVRKARSVESAFAVSRNFLNANQCGSAVVSGLALVSIPDSSTGDYAALKSNQDGTVSFTRTSTPTQWLLIDSQTTSASPAHQHGHIVWRPYAKQKSTAAFHAELAGWDSVQKTYSIEWIGGTAQCYGETPVVIQGRILNGIGANELAYLHYDATQTPKWEFRLESEDGAPGGDGEVNIPLWHFSYANDGSGVLVQDFEGGVIVPLLRNALDTESSS